ncbi:hypothetical protein N2152v2_004302 [Parachlorella kessleri]
MVLLVEKLEQRGFRIAAYIPDSTLLVVGPAELADGMQAWREVVWAGYLSPQYKVAPEWELILAGLQEPSAIEDYSMVQKLPCRWENSTGVPRLGIRVTMPSSSADESGSKGTHPADQQQQGAAELGQAAATDWEQLLAVLCNEAPVGVMPAGSSGAVVWSSPRCLQESSCWEPQAKALQGTSMATPVAAGSATLVRQYFMGGYHVTGVANSTAAFTPSGALIKAVLISGASALQGVEADTGAPIAAPPSYKQGFGRVNLGQSVYLPTSGSTRLQVVDDTTGLNTGGSHSYCIIARNGLVKITLVWTDYPGSPAASKALVNDLDLVVRAAGLNAVPMYGNGGSAADASTPDRENNVEQVVLEGVPGYASIVVQAYSVYAAAGAQPFALVVTGDFQGSLVQLDSGSSGTCQVAVAVITSGPPAATAQAASFAFSTAVCTSPRTYTSLPDGSYIFWVQAQGQSTPAKQSFVQDRTAPMVSFSSTPPATTANATAQIGFSATDLTAVTYTCTLSVTGASSLQAPVYMGTANSTLEEGQYGITLRAIDSAGRVNETAEQSVWVAFTPPTISISSGPSAGAKVTSDTVTFGLAQSTALPSGVAAGIATFETMLVNLDDGYFVFKVYATDIAGNQGSTTATAFQVQGGSAASKKKWIIIGAAAGGGGLLLLHGQEVVRKRLAKAIRRALGSSGTFDSNSAGMWERDINTNAKRLSAAPEAHLSRMEQQQQQQQGSPPEALVARRWELEDCLALEHVFCHYGESCRGGRYDGGPDQFVGPAYVGPAHGTLPGPGLKEPPSTLSPVSPHRAVSACQAAGPKEDAHPFWIFWRPSSGGCITGSGLQVAKRKAEAEAALHTLAAPPAVWEDDKCTHPWPDLEAKSARKVGQDYTYVFV